MENHVEIGAVKLDLDLPRHKVVPHNTIAYYETKILDLNDLEALCLFVVYVVYIQEI